jgi:hypothetical protein
MELLDHFRPPLSVRRHWHAFHNAWATYLSSDLNRLLPEGYFAEPNVRFVFEIDVATFEEDGPDRTAVGGDGTAAQPASPSETWSVPSPTLSIPISTITETAEILVFDREGGPTLAAAIELVSPANKDRAAHRDAFVSKCAAYLQQGIGLVLVDVVTDRRANLHDELFARLSLNEVTPWDADLYAVAYRLVQRQEQVHVDIWQQALVVGGALPTMPLWLPGHLCLPVDLESTYDRTCREQRITGSGS